MKPVIFASFLILSFLLEFTVSGDSLKNMTGELINQEFGELYKGEKTIFVGSDSGLYKEENERWMKLFECRGKDSMVHGVVTLNRGRKIYVATENGLYKSLNAGISWRRINIGSSDENFCNFIIRSQFDKRHLYLGTKKGIFHSGDSGRRWSKMRNGLEKKDVYFLADLRRGENNFIFALNDNQLYRIDIKSGLTEKIFGLYINDGEETDTDQEIVEEALPLVLNSMVVNNGIIYVSTNRGVFLSRDLGKQWSSMSGIGILSREIKYITCSDGGVLLVSTEEGVYEYVYASRKWRLKAAMPEYLDVRKLIFDSDSGYTWLVSKNHVYKFNDRTYANILKGHNNFDLMKRFSYEPGIIDVHEMAIEYAEVHPAKIKRWRREARYRAFFPKISFGIDESKSDTYSLSTNPKYNQVIVGPEDMTSGWDLTFTWDLADFIYNESQTSIDTRSKLMVQLRDDIIDQVTRLYFERRRLQIELLKNPSENNDDRLEKLLRLEELTAGLDGLTGGKFSNMVVSKNE